MQGTPRAYGVDDGDTTRSGGDVGGDSDRAERASYFVELLGRTRDDHDVGPESDQLLGHRAADAAATAGDQRGLAAQLPGRVDHAANVLRPPVVRGTRTA